MAIPKWEERAATLDADLLETSSLGADIHRITFFGRTGTGKSTTLNALFDLDCKTGHGKAFTRKVTVYPLTPVQLRGTRIKAAEVVDTPGHGESLEKDEEYLPAYRDIVRRTHHLVWLLQSDVRYYRADQCMLRELVTSFPSGMKLTLALSRLDCFATADWDVKRNNPSRTQRRELPAKMTRVVEQINKITPVSKQNIVCYSAMTGFGLPDLRTRIFTR